MADSVQKVNGKYHPPNPPYEEEEDVATQNEKIDDLTKSISILTSELSRKMAKDELEGAQTREIMHRLANNLENPPKSNGSQWIQYSISVALIVAGWVFSGVFLAKSTESEIKINSAVQEANFKALKEEFAEFKREVNVKLALSDERDRQRSIEDAQRRKK